MAFWDIFTHKTSEKESNLSQLHYKIEKMLPERSENELIVVACLAGLLARIAYIDFEVHKDEIEAMKLTINKWSKLDEVASNAVVDIAIDQIKELAGLENHLYCHPLNEILDIDHKYSLLEALFGISASDGDVSLDESEEIRIIANALRLEHKHYISARATVLDLSKI